MWRLSPIFLVAVAAQAQTVDGTLTDSITQAPIPNVVVTLLGRTRYDALTDGAGGFHFPRVLPGKYFLDIVKAGYVLPTSRSGAFQVVTDTRLSVAMDRLGRVEGRVRYPDGRPAPGAKVALNGESHNYTGDADPGGHFLLEDVVAGSYILRATAEALGPKVDGEIWAPTYFPATIERGAAEPIPVANGLTATREVRLRSVPAHRIRGMVRNETGEPTAGVRVRLEDQTSITAADGMFEFLTRDGEWRLTAARKDADVERRGLTTVFVSRHDVENVDIRLASPFSVPLLIEGDKDTPAPGRPTRPQMVVLWQVDGVPQVVQAKPDCIPNVYPGRYTIQVMSGFPGSYVESIKLGDIEVYDRPFDLWDGSLPIRITYKRGAPDVRGAVEAGEGAKVFMINADESLAAYGSRSVSAGRGGSFRFDTVRPGDYYVFALLDGENPAIGTPTFQRAVLPRATKVHAETGGAVVLNLEIIPRPE